MAIGILVPVRIYSTIDEDLLKIAIVRPGALGGCGSSCCGTCGGISVRSGYGSSFPSSRIGLPRAHHAVESVDRTRVLEKERSQFWASSDIRKYIHPGGPKDPDHRVEQIFSRPQEHLDQETVALIDSGDRAVLE